MNESVPEGDLAAIRRTLEADPFARSMGMVLEEVRPGYARLRMPLRAEMMNFHGTAHGGAIFALADAAHAAASNSRGRKAVALHLTIDYLRPARAGGHLVAEASEADRGRRTALYRIEVREDGFERPVAVCQGRVHLEAPDGPS